MRRVVVDMQNALFADAIAVALQKFDSDFEVCQSESPAKTTDLCFFYTSEYSDHGGHSLHAVEAGGTHENSE